MKYFKSLFVFNFGDHGWKTKKKSSDSQNKLSSSQNLLPHLQVAFLSFSELLNSRPYFGRLFQPCYFSQMTAPQKSCCFGPDSEHCAYGFHLVKLMLKTWLQSFLKDYFRERSVSVYWNKTGRNRIVYLCKGIDRIKIWRCKDHFD